MRLPRPPQPGSRERPIGRRRALGLAACLLVAACRPAAGQVAGQVAGSTAADLIGRNRLHTVRAGEVLVDLALHYLVGYVELVAANPDIDPWLPGAGTELVIPGEHILPDAPRRGSSSTWRNCGFTTTRPT